MLEIVVFIKLGHTPVCGSTGISVCLKTPPALAVVARGIHVEWFCALFL